MGSKKLPLARQDLIIQRRFIFLLFKIMIEKLHKSFFFNITYLGLLRKSAFEKDVGPWDVFKLKMLTRANSTFSVRALCEDQNNF